MSRMICILPLVSLASCASIVSKSTWPVTIQSQPAGASVKVINEEGTVITQGVTPLAVTLDAHQGYFKGEDLTVEASHPGHQTVRAPMPCDVNPWYFGNIIFGGLIGMLIVDPATGAMWKYKKEFMVTLPPATGLAPKP